MDFTAAETFVKKRTCRPRPRCGGTPAPPAGHRTPRAESMETEGRLAVAGDGARRGSRGGRWHDTGNVYVIHTLSHGGFSVMGLLPSTRGFGYCNFAKFLSSRNVLVIIAPLSSHINFGIRSPRASEILLESLLAQLGLDINFQGMDVLTVWSPFTSLLRSPSLAFYF